MAELDLKLQDSRGMRAAELLNDDVLIEALDAIESEVIAQWEQCPSRDDKGKELLWQIFKTSKKFRALLLGYVQTGKLARENMRALDGTKSERLRNILRAF